MDNFMEDLFSHGWITTFNKHRDEVVSYVFMRLKAMAAYVCVDMSGMCKIPLFPASL